MELVFLGIFAFGAMTVVASAVMGPMGHAHHPGVGSHAHGVDSHVHAHGAEGGHAAGPLEALLKFLNMGTVTAFCAWFGAVGFIGQHYFHLGLVLALAAAIPTGILSAWLIMRVLGKIAEGDRPLRDRDFDLVGTLARVTVTIPEHGVGEILFTKAERRRSEAAKGLAGQALARDTEVVITDYQRGIAVVQPWEAFVAETRS